MEEWTLEMSEDLFKRGSIVELFVYVYGLYMSAGWADVLPEWSKDAIKKTSEWLSNLMYVSFFVLLVTHILIHANSRSHEPDLLSKRGSLFR